MANSLTGTMTIAPNPSKFDHLFLYKHSTIGIKKLNVFPLPVLDAPNTSLPANA